MRSLQRARLASWGLLAAASAAVAGVWLGGSFAVSAGTVRWSGTSATLGVTVDAVSAALLLFVSVVGLLVASFAERYLDGESTADRLGLPLVGTLLGTALVLTAASLPVLLVGWVAAGLALCSAVGHRGDPTARSVASRTRRILLAGDALLALAVVVLAVRGADLDRASLTETAQGLDPVTAAAVAALIVAAGLVRSAQVPFHRWLPETAAAATPVSALLHAGLVNGAGILAVLLWPLLVAAPGVLAVTAVVGAVTVVVAGLQMRARPDVKGRLACSTSAQMGWMTLQVGLGVPAAALVHIIGHGLFKATLFLGSGSAVEPFLAHRDQPVASGESGRHTAVVGLGVGLMAGALTVVAVASEVVPWHGPSTVLLLGAAAVTSVVLAVQALTADRALQTGRRVFLAAGSLLALAGYLLVVGAVDRSLSTTVPALDWPDVLGVDLGLLVTVLVFALLVTGVTLDAAARRGRLLRLRVWALRAALPPRTARNRTPFWRTRRGVLPADHATEQVTPALRAGVRARANAAAELFVPTWGLDSFVATNPLGGLVHLPVDEALRHAARLRGTRPYASPEILRRALATTSVPGADPGDRVPAAVASTSALAQLVDDETTVFLAAWSDRGEAPWGAFGAEVGPWVAWRRTLGPGADRALGARGLSERVLALPDRADEALAIVAERLGLSADEQVEYFAQSLGRVAGWTSQLARQGEHATRDDVLELLALRSALVEALVAADPSRGQEVIDRGPDDASTSSSAPSDPAAVEAAGLLAALTHARREPLLRHLRAAAEEQAAGAVPASPRPDVDVVMCIDVRSELLRRELESVGAGRIRTLGFAGFFGVPLRHVRLDAADGSAQCPVLLAPRNDVSEEVDDPARRARVIADRRSQATRSDAWHTAETGQLSPFALAEVSGPFLAAAALARTLAPGRGRWAPTPSRPGQSGAGSLEAGFSEDERVYLAEAALRTMGMVDDFARLVVLTGHTSTTVNNPFAAGYDCGACGGNGGSVNARVLADFLTSATVRARLVERGLVIPADTVFAAALHDTTRDTVTLMPTRGAVLDPRLVSRFESDLAVATAVVARRRSSSLPGSPPDPALAHRHVARRALDWAQVRPEWGLAGNHAFVAGPRALTSGMDLSGRVFLHSYRHESDPEGAALEVILTAPLVVAQWINAQYLATTVDPDGFGSGSKTVHNVVGRLGVMAGARGDLRPALPRQAVLVDDETARHEPLPLLAVVHAPTERVDSIVGRHGMLQDLCGNGWVTLVVIDPGDATMRQYVGPGRWAMIEHGSEDASGALAPVSAA
ncbi:MAG TPA: putative inorganic carbon transporter subunit DabA [Candidatus Limnocylindria bacterium]|nr:putative inorganic carbon transporter subunit DabA [Candidatus Limnocylindria bacterium]